MGCTVKAWAALLAVVLAGLANANPRGRKGEGPRECLKQTVRAKLLEELEKMTDGMIKSLPKDHIKHRKLLPKFGKSMEKPSGISVLKEILKFYSEEVFSKKSLEVEININVMQLLISSLETDVENCLASHHSALDSTERSEIQAMKRTFTELKGPGVHKAVGEFKTVLDWVQSYTHRTTGNGKPRADRA
ncbi:hypothetical protein SKAU_G00040710 [Synaphobranchus kaupii]|uniref:Interleukin family protein n=1 Tax=Synaphobranchus kaupii TaxID=118154 RepID=A0A9Q1G1W1_SYNKA|nr:hypothetical protein SKAU_G00040710 [Synaphobranchus kaupii]